MSTASKAPARPARGNGAMASAAAGATGDLWRQELVVATDMMSALFESFEALREMQARTAREAAAFHQSASRRLAQAAPADAISLEAEVGKFDLEQGARYWMEMSSIALQSQVKLGQCAMRMLGTRAVNPLQSAFDVWQSPFSASLD
ncbi:MULTISPECIES: phasin family protein [Ramlibacter]|uniref:Phasin family protein n=1 Tax=Ramlibacter aquaticus TaxID=2780094 RepID=A0ABR9SA65_9BURK|nr:MULTISPECIES: phasin family protein [Ramlibacter]MBE7939181.1 phasin family protein [Ramlibacter aquaticus]